MVGVHRFVPEVPGDFEDLLESPDNQSFQVQLGCNTEEQLLVKEVVVGGEWPGIGTPVYRLENGGFELEESVVVEIPADKGYDPAPVPEGLPALLVDDQVDVPLAVALLDIGKSVKLLGQGADRLAQEGKRIYPYRDLAQFCPEHMAGNPDDVSPLDELVEELELLLAEIVFTDIELDLTTLVPYVSKDGFAMVPDNVNPAGSGDRINTLFMGDICIAGLDIEHRVLPVKRRREDRDTFVLECTDFVKPCLVKSCIFCWTGHRKTPGRWDDMYRNYSILIVIIPSAFVPEKMNLTFTFILRYIRYQKKVRLWFFLFFKHIGRVFQKPVNAICRWMDFDKLFKIMNGKMALHEKCHIPCNESSARSCSADS